MLLQDLLTSFWGSFVNLFSCKLLEKYLGSTYTPRWTRKKSKRWSVQWARATARLKSLWVSSPHPKNSWRRNWMPGSKVSEEMLCHGWAMHSVRQSNYLFAYITVNCRKGDFDPRQDLVLWFRSKNQHANTQNKCVQIKPPSGVL